MNPFAAKFGSWALVTGASSGMGAEFAERLAETSLNVVLVARRKDRLGAVEHRYSVQAWAVTADSKENLDCSAAASCNQ